MTDPQYKPGDIANGHQLTQQPDGSLAWLPITADPQQANETATQAFAPAPPAGFDAPRAGDTSPKPKKSRRGLWITLGAVGALLLFVIIGGAIGGSGNDPTPAADKTAAATEKTAESPDPAMVAVPAGLVGMTASDAANALAAAGLTADFEGEPTAKVVSLSTAEAEVEAGSTITLTLEQPPTLTMGQQNAVSKAQSYLALKGFSRLGLIAQLEFEGFSTEDATFAADHIAPDWNAEAAESAKSYLELTSFSRQGLIDQLIFEEFTPEQAEAGVAANGY